MTTNYPAQLYNTFRSVTKELAPFADVSALKLAFDVEGNAYLQSNGFSERLTADPALSREVANELRSLIAKHCPRVHPTA